MSELISIAFLFMGIIFAMIDDRNGDKHPNKDLVFITIFSSIGCFISTICFYEPGDPEFVKMYAACCLFSAGLFIAIFPYAIVYMLVARGIMNANVKWYDHLSKTAWPDNQIWWNKVPYYERMAIVFTVCLLSSIPYFKMIV